LRKKDQITFVNQIIERDCCEADHYNLPRTALIVIAVGFPGLFLEPMPLGLFLCHKKIECFGYKYSKNRFVFLCDYF
jgi:hypothetical protein